jgi:uncharacterized membrane protein
MSLQRNKTLILVIVAIAALFLASPVLQQLIVTPQTDYLTEMALLGPDHDADYPSNVTSGQNYRLYLEISNHLGYAADYTVEVKFRDASQSGPDSFSHTSSSLPSMKSIRVFAADNQTVELPLDISFQYSASSDNINVQSITVNGEALRINSPQIAYDYEKSGFYGNLFFELWIQNQTTNSYQYHERYVGLWLKMLT